MISRTSKTLESGRVIAFRPEVARLLGSIPAAILYQQLMYWSERATRDDGFVYKTADDIEDETTLTEKQQRGARKILITAGWIESKLLKANGAPTLHFRCLMDIATLILPKGQMDLASEPNRNSQKAKSLTRDYNIDYDKEVTNVTSAEPVKPDPRDPNVSMLVETFETTFALKLPRAPYQRRAAKTLISRFGPDTARRAVIAAAAIRGRDYAPQILSLEDLRDKWNKLEDYYRREGSKIKADNDLQDRINRSMAP